MPTSQLENGALRAGVLPGVGGDLLRFDLLYSCDVAPIFRSGTIGAALHDPRAFACFPLVPWSNRIDDGRFPFQGRTIEVSHTRGSELYPLHGHGWLMLWHPASQTATSVELVATADHGHPFRYLTLQRYALADNTLNIALAIRNEGSPLSLGLGTHPLFPRTPNVQLRVGATAMWQSAPDNLLTVLNTSSADANFRKLRKLEVNTAIDRSSEGRDGRAEIVWPSRRVSVSITAGTSCYVLYAPVAYNLFCFKLVDHVINAHNLSGSPQDHGLTVLGTRQNLQRNYQFAVNRPDA